MTIRADDEEETKLHVAVRMHNLKLVRAALRDRGLDIDALGTCGWTALHEAASCGYQDIVELLLENGADPNIQDSVQKCTPIHLAARKGHLEVVRSLVQSGARLDLKNSERKIPQDYAQEQCRVFLMRQRIDDVVKLSPSPVEDNQSVQRVYGGRSSQSPVLSKVRRSSPQWSESSQSSTESMSSTCSGSSESFYASSPDIYQPGPGEIKVALDFNRSRHTLIVRLEEIRDVKLPADHNLSHVYVKCYIVPDFKKATKRKTALHTLLRNDGGRSSSDSVASWSSEDNNLGKPLEKSRGKKFVSSLRRGSRFSSKKKRDQDQVSSMPQNMVAIYRISTKFSETFRYDSAHLRKVDFDTANVQLVVSGRNRVTLQSQTVACLTVPLASCGKMTTPQWLPLVYRILLPSGQCVEEQQPLQQSKSWEDRRATLTRRSSAWDNAKLSMSMPNIEYATSSTATSQTFPRTSQGGEGGFPVDGSKKYKKHSGAGKMLKKEMKLLQGKGNYRYGNSAARRDSEYDARNDETVVASFCNDDIEGRSRATLPPRPNYTGRDLNRTMRDQSRDSADRLRDQPTQRVHENRRSGVRNSLCDDAPEVVDLQDDEQGSRPELEHRSSFARSLKYSRAFQQQKSASHRQDIVIDDMESEDLEEAPNVPFTVSQFYGRRNGIACS